MFCLQLVFALSLSAQIKLEKTKLSFIYKIFCFIKGHWQTKSNLNLFQLTELCYDA